jgi:hypothetical protein
MNSLIRFPLARLMKRPGIPDEALDILQQRGIYDAVIEDRSRVIRKSRFGDGCNWADESRSPRLL